MQPHTKGHLFVTIPETLCSQKYSNIRHPFHMACLIARELNYMNALPMEPLWVIKRSFFSEFILKSSLSRLLGKVKNNFVSFLVLFMSDRKNFILKTFLNSKLKVTKMTNKTCRAFWIPDEIFVNLLFAELPYAMNPSYKEFF